MYSKLYNVYIKNRDVQENTNSFKRKGEIEMTASTFTKITFNSEKEASTAKTIIKNLLNNYSEFEYEEELEKYENDLLVEKEVIIAEDSYSLISNTFCELLPVIAKELAKSISSFELIAGYDSYNCAFMACVSASFENSTLTIKRVVSENGDGHCPECGEQVVFYDEYDPNKKYYCPECGEELNHLDMFDGELPEIDVETIKFN